MLALLLTTSNLFMNDLMNKHGPGARCSRITLKSAGEVREALACLYLLTVILMADINGPWDRKSVV